MIVIVRLLPVLLCMMLMAPRKVYSQFEGAWSFEQLDSLQKIEEKPVVVFIHTDWCRYCQAMKQTTFQDEAVTLWLDSAFYFVSLDAEAKQDILVQEQTFRYQPTGHDTGQHELAQVLGKVEGKLTFPTLCFLNKNYEIVYQHAGFVKASQLTKMLKTIHSSI